MSYALIVLPSAESDLAEALHERPDLAARQALMAEVDATFAKIMELPRRFPVVYGRVPRALTTRLQLASSSRSRTDVARWSSGVCFTSAAIRRCGPSADIGSPGRGRTVIRVRG